MRHRLLALLAGAFLALGAAGPALAQIEPPALPLPTVPPEAQPVLEIVAPVVSPQCGNATLVVALAPGVVGGVTGPLPINILPLVGPAFVICGSVPVPTGKSLLVCAADDQILAAVAQVTVAAAGIPPPVDTRIVGPLVETTYVLQDELPPPANTAGLADTAKATLACRAARGSGTPNTGTAPVADSEPDTSVDATEFEDVAPDTFTDEVPAFVADTTPQQTGSAAVPVLRRVADVGNPGFSYPIVFALPLVILVLGGYLGFALTRPVDVADKRS